MTFGISKFAAAAAMLCFAAFPSLAQENTATENNARSL
jgi:hypothetical protein